MTDRAIKRYVDGAARIAESHALRQWLSVQLDDGHCRFDGYPPERWPALDTCLLELGCYRSAKWRPKNSTLKPA